MFKTPEEAHLCVTALRDYQRQVPPDDGKVLDEMVQHIVESEAWNEELRPKYRRIAGAQRRLKHQTSITLRLPTLWLQVFADIAHAEGRSRAELIKEALVQWIDANTEEVK